MGGKGKLFKHYTNQTFFTHTFNDVTYVHNLHMIQLHQNPPPQYVTVFYDT